MADLTSIDIWVYPFRSGIVCSLIPFRCLLLSPLVSSASILISSIPSLRVFDIIIHVIKSCWLWKLKSVLCSSNLIHFGVTFKSCQQCNCKYEIFVSWMCQLNSVKFIWAAAQPSCYWFKHHYSPNYTWNKRWTSHKFGWCVNL